MKSKQINFNLTISFMTQFMMGSGFGMAGLIDSRTVKDKDNIVYIPASSIKGKIKAEFKKVIITVNNGNICNTLTNGELCKKSDIKDACVICRLFGSEFYEGSLFFSDGTIGYEYHDVLSKIEENSLLPQFQAKTKTGIRINRILKVAEDKALFNYETGNPLLVFNSNIYGCSWLTDEEYLYFKNTITNITHLGGNKGGGLGRCKIELEEAGT